MGFKENLTNKWMENWVRKASRKLNKDNFKFFYTSLFNNHTVKGIGLITIINLQGTSILAINTPNPKKSIYKEINQIKPIT